MTVQILERGGKNGELLYCMTSSKNITVQKVNQTIEIIFLQISV